MLALAARDDGEYGSGGGESEPSGVEQGTPGERRLGGESETSGADQGDETESVRDVVDTFLSIVEQYERDKDNCTPGTKYNLGAGVVAQYGVRRFKEQALVAVNRANFLTRLWKLAPRALLRSEYFFYTAVRTMVEGDPVLFAAGNCYDEGRYKDYQLFCPYAYRRRNASAEIMVKDLSLEYKYLGNDSEFFYQARLNANEKLTLKYNETSGRSPPVARCPVVWLSGVSSYPRRPAVCPTLCLSVCLSVCLPVRNVHHVRLSVSG